MPDLRDLPYCGAYPRNFDVKIENSSDGCFSVKVLGISNQRTPEELRAVMSAIDAAKLFLEIEMFQRFGIGGEPCEEARGNDE